MHDLTCAQDHALSALYAAAARGLPTLADPGYNGAGIGIHVPFKQPTGGRRLGIDNRSYNKLLRAMRALGERGFALLCVAGASCGTSPSIPAASAISRKPPSCSPISSTDTYLGKII